jgi:hypothetical protein
MRSPLTRWVYRLWPVVVWAAVIALFSTHWFTDANTGRIIFPLLHYLFPHEKFHFYLRANFYIRKSAHVSEYFIFSLLLLRMIRGERPGWRLTWALAAVLIVFCYAATDELHQYFVPGRGSEFSDVLLDTTAAAAAQALATAWIAFRGKTKLPGS